MRSRYAIPLAVIAAVSLLAQTQPASQPATRPEPQAEPSRPASRDFSQRYGVLIDNNIFLRERGRPAWPPPPRREPTTQPAAPAPTEEQSFALLGVVFEGDDFRAYFESLRDASIIRVEPGDALARGRVLEMQADAVAYESDGRVIWIEVGQDLTGSLSRSASAATQPGGGATQPANAETSGNPATMSIEERMRQRRRQMMNGR